MMPQVTRFPLCLAGARLLGIVVACLTMACEESPDELVARLGSRDPRELKEVSDRLLQHDSDVVPALRQGLRAGRWRARFMSAELLGTLRARVAVDDLIVVLADSNAGVVERAATALGAIADTAAVNALARTLEHPSIDVALAAAGSLEQIASPRAMGALLAHFDDASARLRLRVIQACGTCIDTTQTVADSIYTRLTQALDGPDPALQVAAIAGLRGFAYRGVAPWLLQAIDTTPPEVVYVAVQALGEISGARHPGWWGIQQPDQAQIVTTLMDISRQEGREAIRAKAMQSLGQLRATSAVPLLDSLKATQTGPLRIAAGRALRAVAGEGW